MNGDGFVHLLVSLWNCADADRRAELVACLQKNAANPCIARIHVFADSGVRAWVKDVAADTTEVIDWEGYPSFGMFFDYANRSLRGKVVAIANADVFFDDSLELLRHRDFAGGVFALTRHNVRPSVGWNGRVWERNYGSQDAWIFRTPLPTIRNDLRMGWFGCDGRLARELQQAGIRVTNPSVDIKAWHLHATREPVTDLFTHPKSYFPGNVDPQTRHQFGLRCVPIEPLGRWKIYTCYSGSHEEMLQKWFVGTMQDDFDVVARRIDQDCPAAEYMTAGWAETVVQKIPLILEAIDAHEENGFFLFSDVDVQWFGPVQGRLRRLLAEYPDVDIFFQADAWRNQSGLGNICTGFFVCKGNIRTRAFWTLVGECMRRTGFGDQRTAQEIVRRNVILGLKVGYLPYEFWGPGSLQTAPTRWEPGMPLAPPMDILVHHANWTVGTPNKMKQLEYVASLVRQRLGDRDLADQPVAATIDQWHLTGGASFLAPPSDPVPPAPPKDALLRITQRPQRLPGSFWAITASIHPGTDNGNDESRERIAAENVRHSVRRHGLGLLAIEVAPGGCPSIWGIDDADIRPRIEQPEGNGPVDRAALLSFALRALPPECDKVAWLDPSVPLDDDVWLAKAVALLERYEVWRFCFGGQADVPGGEHSWHRPAFKIVDFGPSHIRADLALTTPTGLSWAARRRLLETAGFADLTPDSGQELKVQIHHGSDLASSLLNTLAPPGLP
jgi:hypothetical protein